MLFMIYYDLCNEGTPIFCVFFLLFYLVWTENVYFNTNEIREKIINLRDTEVVIYIILVL